MRFALLTLTLLFAVSGVLAQDTPPECYHDLNETYQFLADLDANQEFTHRIEVDTVGYSQKDQFPILLVKISDDAATDYDRPTTLFIGHIHGEEILGVEIVLEAIEQLVTSPLPEYRNRREEAETYFVPTMNPEGLQVVFGVPDTPDLVHGPDKSYRKNKRDTVGDDIFRYFVGIGADSSGVDLNRNWGLNWFQGDTLFHWLDESEPYDYYRGETPFSETETQIVRDLHYEVQPMYGITYHSSRSGTFSEKVYFPWAFGDNGQKTAPDIEVLTDVGENLAGQIPKLAEPGTYEYYPSSGRNAKMHDWTYAAGHWINLEVEAGLYQLQPEEDQMLQIIADNVPAIYYLIDRARGEEDIDGLSGFLELHVQDENGQPLVAEVLTPDYWNSYLEPRYTDPVFGVHRRALAAQNYNLIVRAFGYEPDTSVVNIGSAGPARYTKTLVRKPHNWLHLRALNTDGDPIPATFIVHRDFGVDTLYVPSGDWGGMMPNSDYMVETWAVGYIPKIETFTTDDPFLMEVTLVEPDDMIQDGFETELPARWSTSGDFEWTRSGFDMAEGDFSLKSDPDYFLTNNQSAWTMVHYSVPAGAESMTLTGMMRYELEPEYDFCTLEMSTDGNNWTEVDVYNGFSQWRPFLLDLRDYTAQSDLYFRWTVTTDIDETDRGMFLDEVALKWSSNFVSVDESGIRPLEWAFHTPYPNPFNPSTRLRFDLSEAANVQLIVYDVLGREVARVVDEELQAGPHVRNLDMAGHASGMYFARIEAGPFRDMKKIVLMK